MGNRAAFGVRTTWTRGWRWALLTTGAHLHRRVLPTLRWAADRLLPFPPASRAYFSEGTPKSAWHPPRPLSQKRGEGQPHWSPRFLWSRQQHQLCLKCIRIHRAHHVPRGPQHFPLRRHCLLGLLGPPSPSDLFPNIPHGARPLPPLSPEHSPAWPGQPPLATHAALLLGHAPYCLLRLFCLGWVVASWLVQLDSQLLFALHV